MTRPVLYDIIKKLRKERWAFAWLNVMTLKQLKYFQAVAEYGNYTKAAEHLYISQPALSLALRDLEQELKVPLFEKNGRAFVPTHYGKVLDSHAAVIFRELQQALHEISDLASPASGCVTISHISSMNATYIPQLIQAFYNDPENQNIKFNFLEGPSQQVEQNVLQGKCDFGFASNPNDPNLFCIPLYDEELVIIVPKENPLANRGSIRLQEIAHLPFIAYDRSCGISREIDQLFEHCEIQRNIVCSVLDNIMITAMVAAGLGAAMVPHRYGEEELGVKRLHIQDCDTTRTLYAYWKKARVTSPSIIRFREFICSHSKWNS